MIQQHPEPGSYAIWKYYGFTRALFRVYRNPLQIYRLRQFYTQFIRPGELCFDIGAHVGTRIRVWSHLGARVVVLEPQPHCMKMLRWWYGTDPRVILLEQAVGAMAGKQAMLVSHRSATMTPLSSGRAATVRPPPLFAADVPWESSIPVSVTTLDALIAQYGVPAFCKIVVNGFELEVFEGLSYPIRGLSFAYLPGAVDIALGCLERLECLGPYEFNWSIRGPYPLVQPAWVSSSEMATRLQDNPQAASGGDVYARLKHSPTP